MKRSLAENPWSCVRRVLCVRLDAFGDVLMTGPALFDVKSARCEVTLLTSPSGAEAAKMMPYVDRILTFDAPWMKASRDVHPPGLMEFASRLAALEFDAAIIFTVYTQNPLPAAMLCYLADIPLRLAHCRENPYALLTDWIPETDSSSNCRHEVARQQALVEHVGFVNRANGISISIPSQVRQTVHHRLKELGLHACGQSWLAVHAGATASSRRYPPDLFADAIRQLQKIWPGAVVFTGTAGEADLIDEIRAAIPGPTVSLAGRLNTPELAALIEAAPLLISNNTGPAHVAAAVGTPVVVLYALTNPQHTPWRVVSRVLFHDVPCRYCYKSVCPLGHGHCLTLVPPSRVMEAALELLSMAPAGEADDSGAILRPALMPAAPPVITNFPLPVLT